MRKPPDNVKYSASCKLSVCSLGHGLVMYIDKTMTQTSRLSLERSFLKNTLSHQSEEEEGKIEGERKGTMKY